MMIIYDSYLFIFYFLCFLIVFFVFQVYNTSLPAPIHCFPTGSLFLMLHQTVMLPTRIFMLIYKNFKEDKTNLRMGKTFMLFNP